MVDVAQLDTKGSSAKPITDLRGITPDDFNARLRQSGQIAGSPKPSSIPQEGLSVGDVNARFEDLSKPKPPAAPKQELSGATQSEIENENQWRAIYQGTSPEIVKHQPNLIGETKEDAGGGFAHVTDKEGKTRPIDEVDKTGKETVIMRDPDTGKYHVYKRTPETNEGLGLRVGRAALMGITGGTMPTFARAASTSGKVVQAAERLGESTGVDVRVPRAAASDNQAVQNVARASSNLPGGSAPMVRGAQNMAGDLSEAAARVAEGPAGAATNAEVAGSAVRGAAEEYIKPGAKGLLNQKVNKAYDAVDALMPAEKIAKPSMLENTGRVALEATQEFSAARQKGLDPTLEKVVGAIFHPEGVHYDGLKKLRSMVGEMLQKPPEGMSAGTLRKLYGALSEDMKTHILQRRVDGAIPLDGQRRLQLWERANRMAKSAAERRETIGKILGADTKSDEAIFHSIMQAAGSKAGANAKALSTLKKSIPADAWAEVSSGVLGKLGRRGEDFNPGTFLKDWSNISDHAKSLMFSPEVRSSIDDIVTIANRWDKAKGLAHHSGELSHMAGLAGGIHNPKETIGVMGAINFLSRSLAKPVTAKSAAAWARRAEQFRLNPNNPSTKSMFMKATDDLAQHMARDEDSHEEARKVIDTGVRGVLTAGAIANHLRHFIFGGREE